MKLLAKGNSKLDKGVATWNIPAGKKVCGRECEGCYAFKEQKRWASVRKGREDRYELSQCDNFVELMNNELSKHKGKYVRVHSSGEFYSQEYVNKWVQIAKSNPDKVFYAYTKREEFDYSELKKCDNFVLHKSFVSVSGKRYLNYGNSAEMAKIAEKTGGFVCPLATDRTGQCGSTCTWCMEKENEDTPILFEQH